MPEELMSERNGKDNDKGEEENPLAFVSKTIKVQKPCSGWEFKIHVDAKLLEHGGAASQAGRAKNILRQIPNHLFLLASVPPDKKRLFTLRNGTKVIITKNSETGEIYIIPAE